MPNPNTLTIDSKRKKPRKLENHTQKQSTRWRTASEQQIYSSKLVDALRQVRSNPTSTPDVRLPASARAIRDAADRALAFTAKGRTRWSRAILTNRLKLRLLKKKKKPRIINCSTKKPGTGCNRLKLPALQRRVRVLGNMVPGCRKLSFPLLLEETTDYIAALEMQVRTMAALAELLTSSSSASRLTTSMPG
ncbi:hypothetical protein GIB67_014714 [Kingdonia uniflora]|uniref:BHLH domain-containing protein n=1 Tax=Kingdonia uniflora TaxID=39325 RepID=A0A7J7NUL4_9MAGN|nr:hypothetical protein GIB67_014714 [Kingdonia uniflora]